MEEQNEREQRPPLQPRESSIASFQTAKDGSEDRPEDALERLNLGKPITEVETTRASTDVPRLITTEAATTTTTTTTTAAAAGRTRSGSANASGGMRFGSGNVQHSATMTAGLERNPSAGPSQQQGVGRRSSIVEASGAQLKSWWNNFTGAPAVGEESAVDDQPGPAAMSTSPSGTALKREPSRQEKGNVVFGEKLEMSLIYAAVPISTARHEPASSSSAEGSSGSGGMYVWGYVPVVVAKW
jgi:hypothetical protein